MNYTSIVRTTALAYQYGKGNATLTNINLDIEKGSVYGFLGPNGSGKTTTLSLLLGLLQVQQGTIEIFGQQLHSNRVAILKKIGSLIESPSLYGHLTAKENVEVYRSLYGASKERVHEVLKIVGLDDTGSKRAKSFSLGMRQRLSIALALLPNPELLILDEPANGLDPTGIIELRQLIKKLNTEQGMTIIISSHILAEVEKMVTHIGIISKGHLLFHGPLPSLYQLQSHTAMLDIHTSDNEAAIQLLENYKPEWSGGNITLPYREIEQVAAINKLLICNDLDVFLLHPKEQNLEQLFIQLTSN